MLGDQVSLGKMVSVKFFGIHRLGSLLTWVMDMVFPSDNGVYSRLFRSIIFREQLHRYWLYHELFQQNPEYPIIFYP